MSRRKNKSWNHHFWRHLERTYHYEAPFHVEALEHDRCVVVDAHGQGIMWPSEYEFIITPAGARYLADVVSAALNTYLGAEANAERMDANAE